MYELYLQCRQHIGLSKPIQWQDHGPQFSRSLLYWLGAWPETQLSFNFFKTLWPYQNKWTLPATPSTYWPQYSNSMTRPWTPIFQEPVLLTWSLTGNPSWLKTNLGFCRRRPISVGSGGQLGQVLSQQFQDDAVIFKRKEN